MFEEIFEFFDTHDLDWTQFFTFLVLALGFIGNFLFMQFGLVLLPNGSIMTVILCFYLPFILTTLLVGIVFDRIGTRFPFLIASYLLNGILFIVVGIISYIPALILTTGTCLVFISICNGFQYVGFLSYSSDTFSDSESLKKVLSIVFCLSFFALSFIILITFTFVIVLILAIFQIIGGISAFYQAILSSKYAATHQLRVDEFDPNVIRMIQSNYFNFYSDESFRQTMTKYGIVFLLLGLIGGTFLISPIAGISSFNPLTAQNNYSVILGVSCVVMLFLSFLDIQIDIRSEEKISFLGLGLTSMASFFLMTGFFLGGGAYIFPGLSLVFFGAAWSIFLLWFLVKLNDISAEFERGRYYGMGLTVMFSGGFVGLLLSLLSIIPIAGMVTITIVATAIVSLLFYLIIKTRDIV